MPTTVLSYSTRKNTPGAVLETGPSFWITTSRSAVVKTAQHALRKTHPHIYMPATPFSATTDIAKCAFVQFDAGGGTKGWTGLQYYPNLVGHDSPLFAKLLNTVLMDCMKKLRNSDCNYAQAFAERKQTARLVGDSAKRIAGAITDVRKGDFGRAAARFGLKPSKGRMAKKSGKKPSSTEVGDVWLELQYGWKPLLGDVYGSMVQLHKNDMDAPDRYRVTTKARKGHSQSYFANFASSGIGFVGKTSREHSVSCRLDWKIDNPALRPLVQTGMMNPALLAWELLPWSFVADWFVPIGSYLETLDAAVGMAYLGGSYTYHYTESSVGDMKRAGYNFDSLVLPYWWGRGCSREYKLVNRVVQSTQPSVRFPGLKNPLSLTHLGNALALLRGSVR